MNISDIDPYLRFVDRIRFEPVRQNCKAADCHFYFMNEDVCPVVIKNTQYSAERGTVIIVPAGMDYHFIRDGVLRLVSINFDYTCGGNTRPETFTPVLSENFNEADITERPDFDGLPFLAEPIVLKGMSHLEPLLEDILNEYTYKKQFYREIAASKFKNIIFEVMRAVKVGANNSTTVNSVLEYIHSHYAEDITNADLSRALGYHPYHLNRLMKSATGTTLHQYLIDYRIRMARRILHETDMRIAAVSEQCGYKNISNFSTDFKKKTGISPLRYREELHRMV